MDRIEIEKEDFFARVQRGFELLAQAEPERVRRIDASRSIDEVFDQVKQAVDRVL